LSDIRFYFDESVELVVSQQIAASGIDMRCLGTVVEFLLPSDFMAQK
jgi:hypothetical protein